MHPKLSVTTTDHATAHAIGHTLGGGARSECLQDDVGHSLGGEHVAAHNGSPFRGVQQTACSACQARIKTARDFHLEARESQHHSGSLGSTECR